MNNTHTSIIFRKKHLAISLWLFLILTLGAFSAYAQKKEELVESKSKKDVTFKPPTKGSLAFACNIPDVKVYLNNDLRGTAKDGKLTLASLEKGTYKLEARYPDYTTFSQSVSVAPGRSALVNAVLQPNFGFLVLPNVKPDKTIKVEVDGKPIPDPTKNVEFKGTELYIRISPPGDHMVKVLRGVRPIYNKQSAIKAEAPKVEIPEPETAAVIVQSDPPAPGGQVFVDGVRYSKDLSDKGSLEISELSPNEPHKIQIEYDKYRPYEQTVIPTTDKNLILKAEMEEIIEFFDDFNTLQKWNAPSEWKVENQLLHVKGAKTLGLPINRGFRNSDISFDFKLGNSGRAAWVLRAEDDKNYYLVMLNAPKGAPTFQLSLYVCRNGEIDWSTPGKVDTAYVKLEPNKWHHMRIIVNGNTIDHLITPNEAPDFTSVGHYVDSKNLFPYGNVGFATVNGEDFFVGTGFTICPVINGCRPDIKVTPPKAGK